MPYRLIAAMPTPAEAVSDTPERIGEYVGILLLLLLGWWILSRVFFKKNNKKDGPSGA